MFVMVKLEAEVRRDYDRANRKIILDYILMDPDELKRIGIASYRRSGGSSMQIRGPVPWHDETGVHKERLRNDLYAFDERVLKLNALWET